jgi:hypothetical protein
VGSNSKAKLGQRKRGGRSLGGPQKNINVHRNVALFRIFYGIFLLLKVHLNENMKANYAKIEEVFLKKIKYSVTI